MELLIVAVPTIVFIAVVYYKFIYLSPSEQAAVMAWRARYNRWLTAERKHRNKPAICLNCRFYSNIDRACHRMTEPIRKPADHWCGEFNRVIFIYQEEA